MATAAPHERLLPLQGGRNFRDLGGYRTADGRHVKWGLLFRSGSMHGLTDSDYA
ncbi:tyrosine-protein phosphatase, partial [Klebsiella pneumoniae]|uniref:tyrosine-protein phosphatase n=1 Tax=Klebsiella pneumoniae TaxID=573 RepID=UPI0023AF1BDA